MQKDHYILEQAIIRAYVMDSVVEAWSPWIESLKPDGVELKLVTHTDDVLSGIVAQQPDLFILSGLLPNEEVLALVTALRENVSAERLPILLLSASRDTRFRQQAFAAGISDFLQKPFLLAELVARVRNLVAGHRLRVLLAANNEILEAEVQKRTEELQRSNAALVVANRRMAEMDALKNRFLLTISHEIRTPLNGIFGAIELMQMDAETVDDEITGIYNDARTRIERLLVESEMLARVQSPHPDDAPQSLDIVGLVGDVCQSFGLSLPRILPVVTIFHSSVPEALLRNLFGKFVELVLQFDPDPAAVQVNISLVDSCFVLELTVANAFVAPELLPHFFEPFQVGEHETSAGDLGLTPALVGGLAKLLGGSVQIANLADASLRLSLQFKVAASNLS